MNPNPSSSAAALVALLRRQNLTIATAESCTGGLLAGAITDIAGASAVFHCGVITYSNAMKTAVLDVDPALMARVGAVSAEVAEAMAVGALHYANARVALSITGIAGPEGGTASKPVGTVFIGCAMIPPADSSHAMLDSVVSPTVFHVRCLFQGTRAAVRAQAVAEALRLAYAWMTDDAA